MIDEKRKLIHRYKSELVWLAVVTDRSCAASKIVFDNVIMVDFSVSNGPDRDVRIRPVTSLADRIEILVDRFVIFYDCLPLRAFIVLYN